MKRLENGLIENLEYVRDEKTGKINWLKMIPKEYLYINQDRKAQIEKRLNKKFEEIDLSEVLDSEQVITLQGIKFLLDLRGFQTCSVSIDAATPDFVAASCYIDFISLEGELSQSYTSCASAHPGNTRSWYANYLVEAASNRALCRAVRFYLNLSCVSKEELGGAGEKFSEENQQSSVAPSPIDLLKSLMDEKNISFEKIKARLVKDGIEEAAKYESVDQIPTPKIYELIELCKNKK